MQIGKLQFISNYQSKVSHLQQIQEVIMAGVKWIQYRPKEMPEDLLIAEGHQIAALCKNNGVTFIMNDRVDIAQILGADGVHLGKLDMSPKKARELLGDGKIIGGTANTTDDILHLVSQGVDYVGLGPFRFTNTKKNLSPVLGIIGYQKIVDTLKAQDVHIPLISIGGIAQNDLNAILNTGIYGIAVSSVISEAANISGKAREFVNQIN